MIYTFNKELIYLNSIPGCVVEFFDYYHRMLINGNKNHLHGENVFEFHYVVRGKADIVINFNKVYKIEAGDFFIVGPYVNHSQVCVDREGTEKMTFCLKIDSECLTNELKKLSEIKFRLVKGNKKIKKLFFDIERVLLEGDNIQDKLSMLIAPYVRQVKELGAKRKYDKDKIMEMIKADLTLSSTDVAEKLDISVRTLERICRDLFQKTFVSLRNDLRLHSATNLLEFSKLKVREISRECGYSDYDYFSKSFSKKYGITPLNYRKAFDKTKL